MREEVILLPPPPLSPHYLTHNMTSKLFHLSITAICCYLTLAIISMVSLTGCDETQPVPGEFHAPSNNPGYSPAPGRPDEVPGRKPSNPPRF